MAAQFPPLRQWLQWTFLRYLGASMVALAADMGLFLLLLAADWPAAAASATSYAIGIGVHWLISSRFVFVHGARTAGIGRVRQKALFLGSAFAGLAITVLLVSAGEAAGIDARLSKLTAIAVSFLTTYILRKTLVFPVGNRLPQ
ncbi:GtrA family protein [Sphingopyxis flava]|uniref:Putative flippase GtrA (Transmembrane translocase of bactoprenol-linked glucose) n=1 Tax=Sphingopyxis flava TaxID=1507287 RepID=A0A1T5B6B8_9SPHN|nr:GtrA family protein [Sphingopyxis flava]SKB42589.1 Putative flippase GtrA (transmembrane translocase of bactoprenol-linked glucose) [Sphingopyxis flava]